MRSDAKYYHFVLWTLLLLAGFALRVVDFTYGHTEPCLIPAEELWLYDPGVLTPAVYTVDQSYVIVPAQPEAGMRHFFADDTDFLLVRFAGVLAGVLNIALMLQYGKRIGAQWRWVAAAFVAVAPWLVFNDRWLLQYDLLPLLLMVLMTLAARLRTRSRLRIFGLDESRLYAALLAGMLFFALPLWFLLPVFFVIGKPIRPRVFLFVCLMLFVSLPVAQYPPAWLNGVLAWDNGVSTALIVAGLALAMWLKREVSLLEHAALWLSTGLCLMVTVGSIAQLPRPTVAEWALIESVQQQLPDESLVELSAAVWHLQKVIACPAEKNLIFESRIEALDNVQNNPLAARYETQADFLVTTRLPETLPDYAYVLETNSPYHLIRLLDVPNPVNLEVENQVRIAGYDLITPTVSAGELLDVRVDFQLMRSMDVTVLSYASFIHLTVDGQPGEKLLNVNVPLAEEFGKLVPGQFYTNQHYRFSLPPEIAPGNYDLIFGVYNMFDGTEYQRISMDVTVLDSAKTE